MTALYILKLIQNTVFESAAKYFSAKKTLLLQSGCQKKVPAFKHFIYNYLYRRSVLRTILMESGIKLIPCLKSGKCQSKETVFRSHEGGDTFEGNR